MNAFAEFDTGGGGSEGPWLQWSARGTLDGAVPAKSFLLRDADGKKKFDGFDTGVVLDVANMKTGWCYSSGAQGEAPDWKMNRSLSKFEPQPGDDYKKGFKMRVAIGGGKTASWDQAGAAAWNAFCGLIPALQSAPPGDMLPLVRITGTRMQQFKRGSTVEPILEVVKWVPRPDCLKEGFANVDAGSSQPATPPAQAAPPASVPAGASF